VGTEKLHISSLRSAIVVEMFILTCDVFNVYGVTFRWLRVTITSDYLLTVSETEQERRTIAGRTAWCRCKFRNISNFTTASCGSTATARLSCWSLCVQCWPSL